MSGVTLIEFLLARITEDETTARERGQWDGGMGIEWVDAGGISESLVIGTDRVLAECEAKRKIVELHGRDHECSTYDDAGEVDNCTWVLGGDCSTMRLVAAAYADHEDYRPEWRP